MKIPLVEWIEKSYVPPDVIEKMFIGFSYAFPVMVDEQGRSYRKNTVLYELIRDNVFPYRQTRFHPDEPMVKKSSPLLIALITVLAVYLPTYPFYCGEEKKTVYPYEGGDISCKALEGFRRVNVRDYSHYNMCLMLFGKELSKHRNGVRYLMYVAIPRFVVLLLAKCPAPYTGRDIVFYQTDDPRHVYLLYLYYVSRSVSQVLSVPYHVSEVVTNPVTKKMGHFMTKTDLPGDYFDSSDEEEEDSTPLKKKRTR